ncbi:GIY-YIG nuclease family protein [Ferrovum sp.]|uniref:GIY-YIG nuclease family protein n=1 Tax=Ferrovum sp. TaxID=2609467 RepID=UPI00261E32D8|nr:GIY-YIG nuclease family protein [Ferrovum sp.]
MAGIIYVLTNDGMPDLVKIGITNANDVLQRITQLSSHSGVPFPFICHFAAEVEDNSDMERKIHALFSENRVNPKREFFKIAPERVVLAISIAKFKDVTPSNTVAEKNLDPDDRKSLEAVRERRPRVNLGALGIAPGDQLTFSRDDAIVTIVVPDGKVNFDGEIMSLSAAALKALNRMGYTTTSASGSEYWMFDGETIDERRRRLEAEKFDQSSENMN